MIEDQKIYVWVPDLKYRGRLIGPEGQNISTLEYITRTDIYVRDDHWVIVNGVENSDLKLAAHIIWVLFKSGLINPLRIIKLADEYSKQKNGVGLFERFY